MAQSFEQLIVEPPGVSSDKAHCDLDAAWVNIDSDEADSTSSEWDSPRLSAPETVQAPSKEAALPAEAAADSVPKVAPPPAPAGAVLSPAHKAGFDLEKEYLLAELESVLEMTKDHTYKVTLKAAAPAAKALQMYVGNSEGKALAQVYRGWKWQAQGCRRPLTYDFMKNALDALGCTTSFIRICASDGGVFYARTHFKATQDASGAANEATLNGVDSRPSDALNLALRSSAKIFVHRQLILEQV